MIVDAHTHIFPQSICNQREDYFSEEAAFKLLYDSPTARLVDVELLINAMDDGGVGRSIVFGFPWHSSEMCKRHNDYILESVAKFPDRLTGLCCLDVNLPDTGKEVERCLKAGLSGVGELAFYQAGIDTDAISKLQPVMTICREQNVPVVIHTNEPIGHSYAGKTPISLRQIYGLVTAFQQNILILAHWGGGLFFYALLKKEVKTVMKNVYFDTAASPFLYEPEIYKIAKLTVGVEKVMFGSDYPLIKPNRYFHELEEAGLTEKEKEKICGQNACRVFNL